MKTQEKIGLLGGTFDPLHTGHIGLARHVLDQGLVAALFFVPAAHPPHKQAPHASFLHRLAMLEVALAHENGMVVCPVERDLASPSYTIRTIRELQSRHPDVRFSLIIGADSLVDLHHWHQHQLLLASVDWIVIARQGIPDEQVHAAILRLDPGALCMDADQRYTLSTGCRLHYLATYCSPVSSSVIRSGLRSGIAPSQVPSEVLAYIERHHLYGVSSRLIV